MDQTPFDELIYKYRFILLAFLTGLILVAGGIFYARGSAGNNPQVEVLGNSAQSSTITVEIAGAVKVPGVYKLEPGSRVDNLIASSGGVLDNADRSWTEKYLNKASFLTDGQKIYIPRTDEQTPNESANNLEGDQSISSTFPDKNGSKININTSTLGELDTLPGIGPKYGQTIIDQRPYSNIEDLLTKGVLKQNVYEKIKDLITVY